MQPGWSADPAQLAAEFRLDIHRIGADADRSAEAFLQAASEAIMILLAISLSIFQGRTRYPSFRHCDSIVTREFAIGWTQIWTMKFKEKSRATKS
jgi:hypothetical protein